MSTRVAKILALEARLAALRQAQQAAEQRARAAASKAERARDTRRKVLAGAFLLQQAGSPEQAAHLRLGDSSLLEWLRPADRVLFVPAPAPAGAGTAASSASADPAATATAAGVAR